MALRTAVMNPADISPQIRRPRHLARKLVLLSLLTAAYALGLIILLQKVSWFPLILFSYFATGTVSVVAGFGTRLLLSNRHWLIRSIIATIMPLAGLAILGYFSDWTIGIRIIELVQGYVNWPDLIHIILGITASWAALWAWHRPASDEADTSTGVGSARQVVVPLSHRVRLPRSWSFHPRLRITPRADSHPGNGSRPPLSARLKIVTRQPLRSRRRTGSMLRRPHVQLAVVEEHRCPYCLETVSRNDPGGVKECEVCHSLHHADCWAITGTCQVPHLNT